MTGGRKPKSGALDILLGERIRRLRRDLGMSQTALAARVGMTFQQVQKYENGTNRIAAMTLVKLAEALGVTSSALLNGLEESESASSWTESSEDEQLAAAFARLRSTELRLAV